MRRLLIATFLLIAIPATLTAASGLSEKQVRKIVSRLAGAHLPGDAVRVKRITEAGSEANATVELETAFRLLQDKQGRWRVDEVRMGQDQWEHVPLLAQAANARLNEGECTADTMGQGVLSPKNARCIIAGLLSIKLPSEAVRVRDISNLNLPFASQPSALVVALIEAEIHFTKDKSGWRASEWRTGEGTWLGVTRLADSINEEKRKQALAELTTIAGALENYRKESGFYVVSDKHPVLIDHLSPRYLAAIIRLDPWNHPYVYEGQRDRFVLRSKGPDGKENTPDDVVVARP